MAQPLVLIHGMWCNGKHLARLDELFSARTYDCLRVTLPHHEPAPGQPEAVGALSITRYVQHVREAIAAAQFSQPPVLVGHSMGGLIAQILAAQMPVAALVLLTPASPAGINALHPRTLPWGLRLFARAGFWRRAQQLSPEHARRYAVNGLHVTQQEKIINSLVADSGRMLCEIAFWWADGQRATRVDAKAVRCPVYVLSAGNDALTPAAVVRKVAQRYAGSTYRHWPGRGHWVIDDIDTEEMVYEIDGWLRPILQKLNRIQPVLPRVERAA